MIVSFDTRIHFGNDDASDMQVWSPPAIANVVDLAQDAQQANRFQITRFEPG
jgi:hypothetical protein